MIICPKCNTNNEDDSLFCNECGTSLQNIEKTPVPQPAEKTLEANLTCPKCNFLNEPGTSFCVDCGTPLNDNTVVPPPVLPNRNLSPRNNVVYKDASEYAAQANPVKENKSFFVDSDEQLVMSLGSGFFQNIISDSSLSSVSLSLTMKRVYFSGLCFSREGNRWRKIKTTKIIDVDDITGTGFVNNSQIGLKILSIFLAVCSLFSGLASIVSGANDIFIVALMGLLMAAVCIIIWFLTRKTIFQIEYAGGGIGIDVKWVSVKESENFQKQIHIVKDKIKKDKIKD